MKICDWSTGNYSKRKSFWVYVDKFWLFISSGYSVVFSFILQLEKIKEIKSGKEKGHNLSQAPTQIRDLLYQWFSNWGPEINRGHWVGCMGSPFKKRKKRRKKKQISTCINFLEDGTTKTYGWQFWLIAIHSDRILLIDWLKIKNSNATIHKTNFSQIWALWSNLSLLRGSLIWKILGTPGTKGQQKKNSWLLIHPADTK